MSDIMQEAYQAGYNAKSGDECPYRSGQNVRNAWFDGFVDACVEAGVAKPSEPYFQGRIAARLGQPITDKPDNEEYTGRWVSGWISERE
jgi:ribosome modulation factor